MVTKMQSADATEAAFKALSGNSPSVIHISTHGFFFENKKRTSGQSNQYVTAEDPLIRAGLAMAGANEAWLKGVNEFEEEDGILTALEISNLDLSKTQLVVLSACDTGLGDIDGHEGVYGLQRAFKMAGAKNIIMSLWEVPDLETSEYMKLFYSNWLNTNNVRQAFSKTQLAMQKKYPNSPRSWAGFILVE
jgi:CHAT domain-containing protein